MEDETRQAIILILLDNNCSGMRVGDLAITTHLSRPAISKCLKILYDAGILNACKEGMMYFHPFDPDME